MRSRLLRVLGVALFGAFVVGIFLLVPVEPDGTSLFGIPAGLHYAASQKEESYGDLASAEPHVSVSSTVYGGILSHHLYVAHEIASFFAGIQNQKPSVVVLIGPNHYGLGVHDILASRYAYETPWGKLGPNERIVSRLIEEGLVENDEKPFEIEHSISADVAFIKYFFPDTTLVPVIVKRGTPQEKLDRLARALDDILPNDALVLASVDFSHHNNRIAADFHDVKSISAIEHFNYESIKRLEVDSPASLSILLRYLEERGAGRMTSWHTNSAVVGGNPGSEDVTSYLFAYFSEGQPKRGEEVVSLLNFGDMMFDRGVRLAMKEGRMPFEFIRGVEGNFLRGSDFVIGNLEGPIIEIERNKCQIKPFSFQFASTTPRMLYDVGITLVTLANNHSYDCLRKGITETHKYLSQQGIGFFGGDGLEQSYAVRTVGEKSIAFVGIDETIEPIPLEDFYSLVGDLDRKHDYIVVHIHWGFEYSHTPSSIQTKIGRALVDRGADVVIGHHPHVIQPPEVYKGKAIFYSLGNFIFDQYTEETTEGVGVGVLLGEEKDSFSIFPYRIRETQPKLLPYNDAISFCSRYLQGVSRAGECVFDISH